MTQTKMGPCDQCDETRPITLHGNIWFCAECWAEESYKIEQARLATEKRLADIKDVVRIAQIDQSIEVKSDLFNASTVPAIELRVAIYNDESIPAEEKEYRYTKEMANRIDHLKKVIFERDQEQTRDKHLVNMYTVQVQQAVHNLREESRKEFQKYSIDYQPKPAKQVKPAAAKVSKKVDVSDLKKYAAEYGVPEVVVRMTQIRRNVSLKEAAQIAAREMGLL